MYFTVKETIRKAKIVERENSGKYLIEMLLQLEQYKAKKKQNNF